MRHKSQENYGTEFWTKGLLQMKQNATLTFPKKKVYYTNLLNFELFLNEYQ